MKHCHFNLVYYMFKFFIPGICVICSLLCKCTCFIYFSYYPFYLFSPITVRYTFVKYGHTLVKYGHNHIKKTASFKTHLYRNSIFLNTLFK